MLPQQGCNHDLQSKVLDNPKQYLGALQTLLGSTIHRARKGRLTTPHRLQTSIAVRTLLKTHQSVSMLCLCGIHVLHFVLQAPKVLFRS